MRAVFEMPPTGMPTHGYDEGERCDCVAGLGDVYACVRARVCPSVHPSVRPCVCLWALVPPGKQCQAHAPARSCGQCGLPGCRCCWPGDMWAAGSAAAVAPLSRKQHVTSSWAPSHSIVASHPATPFGTCRQPRKYFEQYAINVCRALSPAEVCCLLAAVSRDRTDTRRLRRCLLPPATTAAPYRQGHVSHLMVAAICDAALNSGASPRVGTRACASAGAAATVPPFRRAPAS